MQPDIQRALMANDGALLGEISDGPQTKELASSAPSWPDPVPFQAATPPPFPRDLLPGAVGAFASALSGHTETPPEMAVLMCLAVASTSVAGRCEVEVDSGYTEPLNLFIAAALESGNRKTAVLTAAREPLVDFEREERERLGPEQKSALSANKTTVAAIERLRKQAGAAEPEVQAQLQQLEDSMIAVPDLPQLWTADCTPEALAVMMSKQGERMAILSDEGGYFDILAGRYSNGIPNLDLVLQAHAGSSVRVNRKSSEPVFLQRPLLTIGLSPQPAVLSGLVETPGFFGRGLLARFFFAVLESNLGYRKGEPHPVPSGVRQDYAACIRRLLKLPTGVDSAGRSIPIRLTFAPSAYDSWRDFQRRVEVELREGNRLGGLKDFGGKLPGGAARIAGILHAVDTNPEKDMVITQQAMDRALTLASILIPHALAAFGLMHSDGVANNARRILKWAIEKGLTEVPVRDVFCAFQSTFKRMENLDPVLLLLKKHCYICIEERLTGGRSSDICMMNPKLLGVVV